jgi:RNA polymerase sigma factor (sigma-70 family)
MDKEYPIEELWNEFRHGSADAYGKLIKLYYKDLYNYGTRFTHDHELVKDNIQDLFLHLWKNRQTIQSTYHVKYYLLKSLRRLIARSSQKNSWFIKVSELEFDAGFGEALSGEALMIKDESIRGLALKMHQVISTLSRRQQEVIYLRFYLDADIADIADIVGINRQSVYNLLHEALHKLKQLPRANFDLKTLLFTLMLV